MQSPYEIKLSNPEDALWLMECAGQDNEKNAVNYTVRRASPSSLTAHSENKRLITEDESDAPLQVDLLVIGKRSRRPPGNYFS